MAGQGGKTVVFGHLFEPRYDVATGTFTPSTVTGDEIQDAIGMLRGGFGLTLGVANPADFRKDLLRSWSRDDPWPPNAAASKRSRCRPSPGRWAAATSRG